MDKIDYFTLELIGYWILAFMVVIIAFVLISGKDDFNDPHN